MLIGGTVKKAELVRLGEEQESILLVHVLIHNTTLVLPLPSAYAGNIQLDQFMRFDTQNEVHDPNRSKLPRSFHGMGTISSSKVRPLPHISLDQPPSEEVEKPDFRISDQLQRLYPQGSSSTPVAAPTVSTDLSQFSLEELEGTMKEELDLSPGSVPVSEEIPEPQSQPQILGHQDEPALVVEEEGPPPGFMDMNDFLHGAG